MAEGRREWALIEDLEGNPRPVMSAVVYVLFAGLAVAFVVSVWP